MANILLRFPRILFPGASFLLALTLSAADTTNHKPWLDVGDAIPKVTLLDKDGGTVDLLALVAEKPTVLIFYRGGWCPYCNKHLAAIGSIEGDLVAAGYQLIAVSPDSPSKLYASSKRDEQPAYTLLSDQEAAAIDAFGLSHVVPDQLVSKYKSSYRIDLEADSGRAHHKLPHPAVYIAGTDGFIRFAYVNTDYKVRLEPEKILAAARKAAAMTAK